MATRVPAVLEVAALALSVPPFIFHLAAVLKLRAPVPLSVVPISIAAFVAKIGPVAIVAGVLNIIMTFLTFATLDARFIKSEVLF